MELSVSNHDHDYSDLLVDGQSAVQLGKQHNSMALSNADQACSRHRLTLRSDSTPVARTSFSGQYSHHNLTPISTFVDRPALREQIEQQLHDQITHAPKTSQTLVVYGRGGVGKTELILHYCQRHREEFAAVFWIDAGTKDSIRRDFLKVYELLYDSQGQQGLSKLEKSVLGVKDWFRGKQEKFLFIFDNADNIEERRAEPFVDLRHYVPNDPSIQIVISTRSTSLTESSNLPGVEVAEMSQNEAMELFLKQSKMNNVSASEVKEVSSIVKELGYVALAITLAASYVSTTPRIRADVQQYLPMYRKQQKRLLSRKPKHLIQQYGTSILTAWETTYHTLEKQVPMACTVLTLLGFFHWDDIFVDIFNTATEATDSESTVRFFPSNYGDHHTIEEIFKLIQGYSFLKFRPEQNNYSMHKLVHTWARIRLDLEQQDMYGEIATLVLKDRISDMEDLDVETKSRLVPHLLSNSKIVCEAPQNQHDFEAHLPYLRSIIQFTQRTTTYFKTGDWKSLVSIAQLGYEMAKVQYGEEDERTLVQLNLLVGFLVDALELDKAIAMAKELAKKRTRTQGRHHSDTLSAMIELACIYRIKEDLQNELSVRMEVFERSKYWQTTPETAENALRITSILNSMGKPTEAMLFLQERVTKHPSQWEMENPDDLKLISSLPKQFELVGDLQQALSIQKDLVDYAQRKWGAYSSAAIDMEVYLASLLSSNGQSDDAIKVLNSIVERRKAMLGSEDRLTVLVEVKLVNQLVCAAEIQKAGEILPGIIERSKQVWGKDHELTLRTIELWDEVSS